MILTETVRPDDLKCSIIRPIYIGGKHMKVKSSELSILQSTEKIIEKYKTLKNLLMDTQQYGFQKIENIDLLLQEFFNDISNDFNKRKMF